jgi:hypothetical protein
LGTYKRSLRRSAPVFLINKNLPTNMNRTHAELPSKKILTNLDIWHYSGFPAIYKSPVKI